MTAVDHLFWVLFNLLFVLFNGAYAVANFRKAESRFDKHMIWAMIQTALVLLGAVAALIQFVLWLRS